MLGKYILVLATMVASASTGQEIGPAGDFALPADNTSSSGDECVEQRIMPSWFYEGQDAYRTSWRVHLREEFYEYKRRVHFLDVQQCNCSDLYPDPEQWRDEFDELIELNTDDHGLFVPPQPDPTNPLTRQFAFEYSSLGSAYFEALKNCNNFKEGE